MLPPPVTLLGSPGPDELQRVYCDKLQVPLFEALKTQGFTDAHTKQAGCSGLVGTSC
jgi:hypothetical protein